VGVLADPSVTPKHISTSLNSGESYTATIQVFTGDVPVGKGDVMLVFDRTSSMGEEIAEAKLSAIQIMNEIRAQLPNSWFGVGSFMDYPDYYEYPGYSGTYGDAASGDVPWELNINPTDNIIDVFNAINGLWLGWGVDWPEDYTRVLYEVISVAWRPHTKKIVVLFGDAPTHDLDFAGYNFGGDPGRDATAQTDDDLDFETVVQQIADEDISAIAVDSGYSNESEATFKGMSIGYDTAPGTNGRYYHLNDTSQIPTVVVQLIREETQQLDRLYLKVTEGYESWVRIMPPEYTDVFSNTTKTFTLTVTVPDGTSPGFYPFMIQAIGDGAILGFTYVDVTVPSNTPISDLGFRPNRDGFRFSNDASTQTWEMFRQFFGAEQVEHSNGNRIHAADVFYQEHYRNAGGGSTPDTKDDGSCDGFSTTSLINYRNLSQPNAGDFAMPRYSPLYSQNNNDEIREAYAFAQGIQMGMEVNIYRQIMCDLLGKSPAGFYRQLKSQIQNGSAAVMGICWDDIEVLGITILPAGCHALAPYRFEEPSGNEAHVYVYDSNNPGDNDRRVEFDLSNGIWEYVALDLWGIPIITLRGDNSKCNLDVSPIEIYRHQGVAWWAQAGWAISGTSLAETTSPQVFATLGPARLLFTDDKGRRLGWDGDRFYDEIPGANYIPMARGGIQDPAGLYYISANVLYDLAVHGYGEGPADINLWSDGYMVQLSGLEVVTGTIAALDIAPDGSRISVSEVTGDTHGSLSINHILPGEDRTVTIGNLAVGPGEEVALEFNITGPISETVTDTVKLSTNSSFSRIYNLSLHRAGGDGYSSFGHASLVLDSSSDSFVEISRWSNLDVVTVAVDLDQDGFVDESRPVSNEAMVNAVSLEASRTSVHTGGEQVEIFVAIRDQFGAYVADGIPVSLSTNLGTLSTYEASTFGGLVHLTLTTGSDAGTATVTAEAGGIESSLDITVNPYTIYLPLILKNYPPDTTPPAAVTNLSTSNPTLDSITLNWTAPGDDCNTGTAWKYDVRYSTSLITDANWNVAAQCVGEPAPQPVGNSETFTVHGLTPNTTYYFALKTADEVPHWSCLSNVASGTTLCPDPIPPAAVTNLSTSNPTLDSVTLNWIAPGDDGNIGTASVYDIRYSTSLITEANWNTAAQCVGEPAPKPAGSSETFTVHGLAPNTTYYFALKTADEVPNWSGLSNVASGATLRPSDQLIINCGFETDEGWVFGETPRPAAYTTEDAHWGARSVHLGIKPPTTDAYSWSSVRQRITIPANARSATLSFWYKPLSEAPCWSNWQQFDWSNYSVDQPGRIPPERNLRSWASCDWQQALILADDWPNPNILATVMNISSNSGVWTHETFDLTSFAGQTVLVYFNVYNNGSGYGRTWMYVDDASVMVYY